MSNDTKTKTWERTKTPGLLRHKGGRYYGRFSIGGKTKFVPLNCTLLEIARQRFAEEKVKVERTRKAARSNEGGTARMKDLIELYRARIASRSDIAESTRTRTLNNVGYILKTWPEINDLRPDQITRDKLEQWKHRAMTTGTGFKPPGAKTESIAVSGRSASSFNKAVDAMRRMLDLAVDAGTIHTNPLQGRQGIKAKLNPRKPTLPKTLTIHAIFSEIEKSGERGGWAVETADFCRFLAYTGCRQAEAASVRWENINTAKGVMLVKGTKTESAFREVPLSKSAIELLARIRTRREKAATVAIEGQPYIDPAAPVLAVREAQNSLTRACAAVGTPRLTHHDLRDVFATTCIEAGVDIPTVAAWLGHADGGALLMKTYNHLRNEHSVAQMAKVTF